MSIKNRIISLVFGLLAFSVLAVSVGLYEMRAFNHDLHALYLDRVVPMKDLKSIADSYAVNIVDTNHKLRNANIDWQQAEQNIVKAQQDIQRLWAGYMATTLTPQEAKLAQNAQTLMQTSDRAIEKMLGYVKAQDSQAIAEFSRNELYPAIDPISDAITDLIDLQKQVASELNDAAQANYESTMTMAIIGSIVIFILAILFSRVTLLAVTRPLNELVRVSRHVQQTGDFSARVKVSNMDEVGTAASAFNELLENMAKAITDANRVVGAVAQSDFSQRISSDYVGDLDKLKQGVNASADQVDFMMKELAKVMQAMHNGQFDSKMDERVPRAFSQQVENALGSINQVIVEINNVMHYMNEGKFQHRVNTEARGELATLKQNINSSMTALEAAVEDITRVVVAQSKGDLTQTIQNEYHGDLRMLTEAVNASAAKLTDVVSKAVTASDIVHSAADEVSKGALDLSQRVQEQAAALEETSATMDQMNSAVQNNTDNAKQATHVAENVQKQATQGSKVMQQTIEAMNSIQESSHKISEIVTLIDGIAFQTNLLALNAAVEAARAGDHGRGFAVVAGEVRALAQKSAEAAKDISALIGESVTRIDQGTKLASESGEMLNAITGSVSEVTQMIAQIARASAEQAEGVSQVHQAIADIDQVTQQNAALVEQTSAASESMSEQAANLSQDMAFFNTGHANKKLAAAAKPQALSHHDTSKPKALSKPRVKDGSAKSTGLNTQKSARMEASDEWSEF
ncbi:methyl-accepting chemotaxis protein [Thiomicrospira sp.]|uniref:methyl-accepting chemotaxis protein n=1 Tax=Thiomicrospira sp. TaxID=935 RepID=UPI002F92C94D